MTCPWSAYEPATIAFCEERTCAWIVEPSNAGSNLAYIVAGVAILVMARRRVPLILIGLAGLCIGLGSFAFHATGTRIGELVDVSAMYLLSALGVMFAVRRITPLSALQLALGYFLLVACSVGLMLGLHDNGIIVFAIQIAASIGMEIHLYARGRRARSYAAQKWMLASFAVGFLIWNLDKSNVLCSPSNHLITGHAIWHALTAVALYGFARHQAKLV